MHVHTVSGISLFTGCHGNEQNECFSLAHDRRSIISLREPNFPIALTAGTQHYFHLLKSVKSVINNDSEFCTLGIHFSILYIFVTMNHKIHNISFAYVLLTCYFHNYVNSHVFAFFREPLAVFLYTLARTYPR